MIQYGIRWPLLVVDFEASALDRESYPIEIGLARWDGPVAPIRIWSSLIRPASEWVRDGVWFESAQKIHGIAPGQLADAPGPEAVMRRLREVARGADTARSDNPQWDTFWMQRLETAAQMPSPFWIGHLREAVASLGATPRERLSEHVKANDRPHRAAADALLMTQAVAYAIELDPTVERLPD